MQNISPRLKETTRNKGSASAPLAPKRQLWPRSLTEASRKCGHEAPRSPQSVFDATVVYAREQGCRSIYLIRNVIRSVRRVGQTGKRTEIPLESPLSSASAPGAAKHPKRLRSLMEASRKCGHKAPHSPPNRFARTVEYARQQGCHGHGSDRK